ncbi:MAG: MBL fold metallo-hydrolase [Deltaproteobacteria bacterium]|nr:MBL fold metallo-hydrolase [Deltaproteobacteria bacterium]
MVSEAPPKPSRRHRWKKRGYAVITAFASVGWLGVVGLYVSTDGFLGFGGVPSARSVAHIRASAHYDGRDFVNLEPTDLMKVSYWETSKHAAFGNEMRTPTCPLPIVTDAAARLQRPPETGLRVTWLGHSTTLVEVDGAVVLTDPNWSQRSSPSAWVGPERFHPPPIAIGDLPKLDAVVISHEHFDHCDMGSIRALLRKQPDLRFHVPLGVAGHLEAWGVPSAQIVEADWWESTVIEGRGVEITSTPARHFNGRGVPWRAGSFWTSWTIVGPAHRVFFSGDTGLSERGLREIREKKGPFDLAMLEIGQHSPDWGDIHLGPAGALDAHGLLGAKHLLPIHWSTFQLAYHDWSEPAETLVKLAAEKPGTSVVTPRLGEPVEPGREGAPKTTPWWRPLPPLAASCP